MKTKNRLFTIIALSIFVLSYILPLHNAISNCVEDSMYNSVSLLESLVVHRTDKVKDAEDHLADKENNDLLGSAASNAFILGKTGLAFGLISSLASGNPLPMAIGYAAGVTTGTIAAIRSHYKAISDAKEALKTAKEKLAHAQAKLDAAKQAEAEAAKNAITPGDTSISIRYNPVHNVTISAGKKVKEVYLTFTHTDKGDLYFTPQILDDPLQSTTISYTFTEDNRKGTYNTKVTIIFDDDTSQSIDYETTVGD